MKLPSLFLLLLGAFFAVSCTSESSSDRVLEITLEISNSKIDSDISVTQGDIVKLRLTSDRDGVLHIHGYDIKVDMFEDKISTVEFVAEATGIFKLALHETTDGNHEHDQSEDGKKQHGQQSEKDSHEHKMDLKKEEVIIGNIKVLPK